MKQYRKKRENFSQRIVYIFQPFVVYLLAKTLVMIGFSMLIPSVPVANALASILAVSLVVTDFLAEVDNRGEIFIDENPFVQFVHCIKKGILSLKDVIRPLIRTMIFGFSSAIVLNVIITQLSIQSAKYEQVATAQYAVPIWLGLILYGIISPTVEEMVFRGILYNRLRRFYKVPVSILVSAVLFGGFHANLPQFLYGAIMGALMCPCYERCKRFVIPLAFHMSANVIVFLLTEIITYMR